MATVDSWVAIAGAVVSAGLGAGTGWATTKYTLGKDKRETVAAYEESVAKLIQLKDETIAMLQSQRDEAYRDLQGLSKRVADLEDRLNESESKHTDTVAAFADAGTCLLAPACPKRIVIGGDPT